MSRVPFSVRQKFSLFNGNKASLKQFLLSKSTEDRELYQEYLLEKRKNLKYVPIVSIGTNFGMFAVFPAVGVVMVPLQIGMILHVINKYEALGEIQDVFDEVDLENKKF